VSPGFLEKGKISPGITAGPGTNPDVRSSSSERSQWPRGTGWPQGAAWWKGGDHQQHNGEGDALSEDKFWALEGSVHGKYWGRDRPRCVGTSGADREPL